MAAEVATELKVRDGDFAGRIMDLSAMVYELLKHGGERDVVVLPYLRQFPEVIGHLRERGIQGPVVIYCQDETMIMNLLDLANQGVVFLDGRRFSRGMIVGFISFLLKSQQQLLSPQRETGTNRLQARPPQNEDEVRALFRKIINHRAKLILNCQFRPSLPTLTVSCEVIQMLGEVETKLVLDKFDPEEFVGLYAGMGGGKPLNGFITLKDESGEDESLGFTLKIVSSTRGRMTALLPPAVYEQKRKFFRVEPDRDDPVTLYILPDEAPTVAVKITDISEGGVGFDLNYDGLIRERTYPVALALNPGQLILGSGKLVFKGRRDDETITYGLSLSFSPDDTQHLRQYVFKRQAGILAALRELSI
ncbi:MAG: Flagellar brake protein YcgR [Deltaproteobacteria bacterium ADurb.Bin510]|nr:MAG: Flagellar brake protein YcgR [Deltaproteobacteria bacterium ADurb.Bin510]